MKKVIILQGVPGSGKTTYAKKFESAKIVSADNFFYTLGKGEYRFDPTRLSDAHCNCFRNFMMYLLGEEEFVIVDNTNTTPVEIAPYYLAAQSYGYEVEIVRIVCPPYVAAKRNIHGVSEVSVTLMDQRMNSNPIPPWWKLTIVTNV